MNISRRDMLGAAAAVGALASLKETEAAPNGCACRAWLPMCVDFHLVLGDKCAVYIDWDRYSTGEHWFKVWVRKVDDHIICEIPYHPHNKFRCEAIYQKEHFTGFKIEISRISEDNKTKTTKYRTDVTCLHGRLTRPPSGHRDCQIHCSSGDVWIPPCSSWTCDGLDFDCPCP